VASQQTTGPQEVRQHFWAGHALLPGGWASSVRLEASGGRWQAVQAGVDAEAGDVRLGTVVPGLGNLHSHAFQRGMAGLNEIGGRRGDSFWGLREPLYRFLDRPDPHRFHAISPLAYHQMPEARFTLVGAFHHLPP